MKQDIVTTRITFSYHNNSFLINDAALFKVAAFLVPLFDAVLFDAERL